MTPVKEHKPFVPESANMPELTLRAMVIGLIMCVVLGAANAYLGLRAGQTIAATYPAAVIGMAILRVFKGSLLEENIARTAGSIGESVAAGAIFTIPAFVITGAWSNFASTESYWKATALMVTGSVIGVLFVSLVRRFLVEDPDLPFPESVAAAHIHKAGQMGAQTAGVLFYNIAYGGIVFLAGAFGVFATDINFPITLAAGVSGKLKLGAGHSIAVGGTTIASGPSVSPALIGVGYVIGPKLAALNFSGSVLAWGVMVPMMVFFLGPLFAPQMGGAHGWNWEDMSTRVWRDIVRPIAIGGMMAGAANTMFRMRKNIAAGLSRAFKELVSGAGDEAGLSRLNQYMSSRLVLSGIGVMFILMLGLYTYFSGSLVAGIVAAVVMLIVGFCFATVSGYLVGVIGSSNNPISGLTLSTLIIAALLMVALGVSGTSGVIAVLGVAAVVCVSSAVAGELLQDFKVGYILGGTPKKIQIAELIAVICASAVMYFPLLLLHQGNILAGGIGFGDPKIPAPQAGLMASLAQGIVGGDMAWPLIGAGICLGITMILIRVPSPMLVAIGMYLPLGTTFAIFVGGIIRAITDTISEKRGHNEAQKARVENTGVLAASGLIAGEALMGLVTSGYNVVMKDALPQVFKDPSYLIGIVITLLLGFILVRTSIGNAGRPEDPAPPVAMM
jgi:putative OPT family oligopeptide transporter